ncbi:hypothetical protein BKP64_04780 [Marinobacter salinus]|uniref:Tetratricopeptide repeat protein n=1 Tax=Marinobacter salinus TaxID=1874317 RepID=A0A1D9GJ15_9GAMM|nr:hypothetical protein [Marinobacter salinus]AOY87541.1 hypothetical protein BKP64_04780 [Marinobacter salinus]
MRSRLLNARPPEIGFLTLTLLIALAMPLQASSSISEDQKAGLTRYALATGQLASVLRFADSLKGETGQFLRAHLLLESGQVPESVAALGRITEGQYHRGEAGLLLGQLMLGKGEMAEAEKWLELAAETGFGETRQKALYQLAELARSAGGTDKAGKILADMDEGYWAAVGYLNLSSDYAREDLNPARALVALRVALAMAEKDELRDRNAELRSRLLVRASYLSYQHGEYEKAISFLEKVSLETYSTPQALYLHGLALSERGNQRSAMQSWHRAKKYPLAYPGVADAWIGMGRGYDLSGYLGQAGEAYLAANAAYESERVTLRKLADRISAQGAYKALVEDARDSDLEWFLADSRTLTQPRMAYLLEFLEKPAAQRAVSRVARLVELGRTLDRQAGDLTVFIETLEQQLGRLTGSGGQPAMPGLLRQQDILEKAVDGVSNVTKNELQKQQIKKLHQSLAATAEALESLDARVARRPAELRKQLQQSRALKARTQQHRNETDRLTARAEELLDALALKYVAEQEQRMAFAVDKTEQQIAHLYEYLALKNLEEAKP